MVEKEVRGSACHWTSRRMYAALRQRIDGFEMLRDRGQVGQLRPTGGSVWPDVEGRGYRWAPMVV